MYPFSIICQTFINASEPTTAITETHGDSVFSSVSEELSSITSYSASIILFLLTSLVMEKL